MFLIYVKPEYFAHPPVVVQLYKHTHFTGNPYHIDACIRANIYPPCSSQLGYSGFTIPIHSQDRGKEISMRSKFSYETLGEYNPVTECSRSSLPCLSSIDWQKQDRTIWPYMHRFENFFDAFDREHSELQLCFEIQYPNTKLSAHVNTRDRRIDALGYRMKAGGRLPYDIDVAPGESDEEEY